MVDREEHGAEATEEPSHPFWPVHVLDQVVQFYLWLGLMLTLAFLIPMKLHGQADPLLTPPGTKPEWYFLSVYQALKYVPKIVGMVGMGALALVTLVWPFVDSAVERRWPGRLIHRRIVVVAIGLMVALGILGKVSETTVSVFGRDVTFSAKGFPERPVEGERGAATPLGKGGAP